MPENPDVKVDLKVNPKKEPFEVRKNRQGQYYWIVTHANGNPLSRPTEYYHNKMECIQSALATFEILKNYFEQKFETIVD